MLTCIACSKQIGGSLEDYSEDDDLAGGPSTRQAIKALTSQACAGDGRHTSYAESEAASESERWNGSCRRTVLGREVEERLRAISGADVTPSMSGRMEDLAMEMEEYREWVAQVEPGVLITLFSLPYGKNDLRRIRFSREMFNRRQAQRWWAENCDKVMELYNVHRLHRRGLPTPPRSEDEVREGVGEQDEPGVYITIRALAGGGRALRRVRFRSVTLRSIIIPPHSHDACELWWEENRARVHQQYL
ncbi:unnamed protein product [Spirodela intermedia]|uniref:BRX domain-containing protein n=1 Tax=Spirodela intermedia TaxID=51605 RepID=A0ABN7EBR7_SPIIN|nr:unnamed protein product [Spirodela intermedia]